MPRTTEDLTGRRFSRLVVVREWFGVRALQQRYWLCHCDCGKEVTVAQYPLKRGAVQSCRCLKRVHIGLLKLSHGRSKTAEYRIWAAMKRRCTNPNVPEWLNYGGRGITVCAEWMKSFAAFFAYMGERPSIRHSIDRIDNEGNYEPGNVRWTTQVVQTNNTRWNRRLEFQGRSMSIADWSRELHLNPLMVAKRLRRGWTATEALTIKPLRGSQTRYTAMR